MFKKKTWFLLIILGSNFNKWWNNNLYKICFWIHRRCGCIIFEVILTIIEGKKSNERLRKLNNQLLLDFDQVSTTLFTMGEIFENLYKKSNNFNNHVNLNKNFKLDDIYVTLNNMMVNWGNSIVHQMSIIQENLCNFFKYEKHYNFCLKEEPKIEKWNELV